MSNTPLMNIVNAAAERFDKRPEYRASVEARAELQSTVATTQTKVPSQGSGSAAPNPSPESGTSNK